ncbi:hypothetical protein EVAR_48102_1 [Eumeta japonica]|uniref:Uncharacterized protein n=1 Tax=Eumeta variegata TaxID=151549 RepID=A0A4C1XL23_EUMVA|nr:hypothetical protein EVAR_48102_1 [Eumeta japonica]
MFHLHAHIFSRVRTNGNRGRSQAVSNGKAEKNRDPARGPNHTRAQKCGQDTLIWSGTCHNCPGAARVSGRTEPAQLSVKHGFRADYSGRPLTGPDTGHTIQEQNSILRSCTPSCGGGPLELSDEPAPPAPPRDRQSSHVSNPNEPC